MNKKTKLAAGLLAALSLGAAQTAQAADTLRVVLPQKGAWDPSFVANGVKAGIFKKAGLNIDILYSVGGAQTMQELLSGSIDVAMATGMLGVIGAYAKGAPMRILSSEITGVPDMFIYTKADGPKTMKDLEGKDVGYSEPGSSSNMVVLGLLSQFGVKAHPVPAGGVPATYTQVMSGQIAAGWGVPPFHLDQVKEGKLRILGYGSQIKAYDGESIRVNVTTAATIAKNKAAMDRFNKAYVASIKWTYTHPEAIEWWAKATHVSLATAKAAVAKFYPESAFQPYKVMGMTRALQQAHDYKFTKTLLTKAEVAPMLSEVVKPPAK